MGGSSDEDPYSLTGQLTVNQSWLNLPPNWSSRYRAFSEKNNCLLLLCVVVVLLHFLIIVSLLFLRLDPMLFLMVVPMLFLMVDPSSFF